MRNLIERLHNKNIVKICSNRLFASALVGVTARKISSALQRFDDAAVAAAVVIDQHKITHSRERLVIVIVFLSLQLRVAIAEVGHDRKPSLVNGSDPCRRADVFIIIDVVIKSVIFNMQCLFLQIQFFKISNKALTEFGRKNAAAT